MDWKQKTSLISFLLIPLVFLLGLAFWFFGSSFYHPQSDIFLQKSPQKVWHELIPNLKKAKVYVLDRPHEPEELRNPKDLYKSNRIRKFHISTNDLGLRNIDITKKKAFRILCVGESVTFGWGVEDEESYPAQLRTILGVEVINAGIPSARIEQSKEWLVKNFKQMDSDLVLLSYRPDWNQRQAINNFSAAIRNIQRIIHPTPLGLVLSPISSFDRRGRQHAKQENQELPQKLQNVAMLDLTPIFQKQKEVSGVRLNIANNMQQLIDVQTSDVLLEFPNLPLQAGKPVLAQGILQAFEDNEDFHEPMIFDGGHPDAQGYRLMAEQIALWIQRNRWYKSSKK